jgi:tetratricopeptide (TPR) repeat protein
MTFYCTNPDCAINQKGKAFPSMMDCPMCDLPLEAQLSISQEEEQILQRYPYVIAYPFERMLIEEDGRNKLELLAYTFLNALKFWGLVLATEYFCGPLKSAKINELFRNNLYQPSYGNWNNFLRETIAVMEKENVILHFPEFVEAYKAIETDKNAPKFKAESPYTNDEGQTAWKKTELTAIGTLINFRNRYLGHGLPLSKAQYAILYKEIYPVLIDFLKALRFTEGLQLLRFEGTEGHLLKGKEISKLTDGLKVTPMDGLVVLKDNGDRQLNLLPFYILPKQFISGADKRAEVMVYEQNTGSRVIFFSPESVKAEESGQVLERIKLLIQEKEKPLPCAPIDFTPSYVRQWTLEHNEKTMAGLKREKKILGGIYQNRLEAENVLCTWFEATSSLLAVSAEAGSGKTNLLAHMQTHYERFGLTTLFIRAARCQTENWEELLRTIWNVPNDINLIEFIETNYHAKSPLMVMVDGGNEHPKPMAFLQTLCSFLISLPPGSMKIVLSWRGNSVSEMPDVPDSMRDYIFPVEERNEIGLLAKHALRLNGLNKIELEGAWNKYAADKSIRCKPNFLFSNLLLSEASLLEELSNPLLLRLFMELFHGKGMPKASKGFINLWAAWWTTIEEQADEAKYLKNLSSEMIRRQQLHLTLDELFDHPILGSAVKNIQIDSPHQQLLRKGIISQYFIDDALQVSFTMEAALYFVAALDINAAKFTSLPLDKRMWKDVGRFYIGQYVSSGKCSDLFAWIDNDNIPTEILVKGLAEFIIINGVASTLKQLLDSPTARDYKILEKAIDLLAENRPSEKEKIATELLNELLQYQDSLSRELKIRLMKDADKLVADRASKDLIEEMHDFAWRELLGWAKYLSRFAHYREAEDVLLKSLHLAVNETWEKRVDLLEETISVNRSLGKYKESLQHIDDWENGLKKSDLLTEIKHAKINLAKGMSLIMLCRYNEAIECYEFAHNIFKKRLGEYSEFTIDSLIYTGDVKNEMGKYNDALDIFTRGLDCYQNLFGESHPNIAVTLNRIGHIWETKGQYDQALKFFERDLKISIDHYGESHPNVAGTLMRIGGVWSTKGQYDKALEYYEKDLKISIEYYGESHPHVALTLARIGGVWSTKGQYDKALEYYEKDLKISIEYYGESHPNIASALMRIGGVWETKGQYDKALEYFEQSTKIYFEYYGEFHPNVAVTLARIGGVWSTKGQYDKALECYEKDLKISVEYYGESHPNVAVTLAYIGDIWKTKGQYDRALEYFQKDLNISIEYYGESHPNVAGALMRVGGIWETKGQYDRALEYYERDLKISIEYYGESHPNVAVTLARIGDIWKTKGQYDRALEYFEQSSKIYIEYYGECHPNVASTLTRIGGIWETKGQYDRALEYFEQSSKIYIDYHGESHPNVADTLMRIGGIWSTKAQYDKALEYYEKDLKISIEYYGENHPNVAATLSSIGVVLETKGQFDKSLEYFDEASKIYIEYYGESHPNVAGIFMRIGGIWSTKGHYDKALEYYEKDLKISIEY